MPRMIQKPLPESSPSPDAYLTSLLAEAPKILTCLNRNPASKAYGSFDREYWHYGQRDFSCCRMQEAVLTLALLFTTRHPANKYYQQQALREWINAAMQFWCTLPNKDGSLSEWYPGEHSFVGSAFGVYALSETLLVLRKAEKRTTLNEIESRVVERLEKAASFLSSLNELRVQNQSTGAAAGFYNLYLLTGKESYKAKAEHVLSALSSAQDSEGWLEEYGGADIGYLSLALDYLAKYHQASGDENALRMMEKAAGFLAATSHPDGTAGGEYASRNTEYRIPFGIEYLAAKGNSHAAFIAGLLRQGIAKRTVISPSHWDMRYLLYVGYTYLQAFAAAKDSISTTYQPVSTYYPNAGLVTCRTPEYMIIINTKKGGAFRMVSNSTMKSVADAGMLAMTAKGIATASNIAPTQASMVLNKSVTVEGKLSPVKEHRMTPQSMIGLRLYTTTFGKLQSVDKKIKEKLRDFLITPSKQSGISYKREIVLGKSEITVTDTINSEEPVQKLWLGLKHSFPFIPSSRLFQEWELEQKAVVLTPNATRVTVERVISSEGEVRLKNQ
ncbi:hypothetical protein HYU19_00040 [Candidatus Woesearchaeota archaeon]|nr:hypothetical protein [Candidatus Woesearchaeota archaeon]